MLGSALIKLRGDSCWRDLTALYYHFETQPIPNPFSRWFHFLPHPVLQFGVIWTFIVELGAPWFCLLAALGTLHRRRAHHLVSIHADRLRQSFLLQLADHPARAGLLRRPLLAMDHADVPHQSGHGSATGRADRARPMNGTAWARHRTRRGAEHPARAESFQLEPGDEHLLRSAAPGQYLRRVRLGRPGAPVIIFEGTDSADPATATDWKEYPYVGSPWDPEAAPAVHRAVSAASRLATLVRGHGRVRPNIRGR